MAGSGKKWLIGCGLGCGIPVLLAIVLSIGGSIMMMKPFNKAVDAQKELTAAHGKREEFQPPADYPSADRLQRFMTVRRALIPMCEDFTEVGEKFRRMDELDQGGEEPSKGEMFSAIGDVMGAALGVAGNIGRFTQGRNEALLAAEMGLGEYIWLYALVYNSWLGYPPNVDFEDGAGGRYSSKEQKLLRGQLRSHAEALAAAGRADEAAAWSGEADRLERLNGSGVPWQDAELPPALIATFEPFRAELDSLYCGATSAFEFSQMRKRGLSITSD